jgi:hypothetical protein
MFVNVCALFSPGVMPLNVILKGYWEKVGPHQIPNIKTIRIPEFKSSGQ